MLNSDNIFIWRSTHCYQAVHVPEIIKRKGKIDPRFSCKNILIRESNGSSSVSMLALVDILSISSLRGSSSQQSVRTLRIFLQETSEISFLFSSTSSSRTGSISTSLTWQVGGGLDGLFWGSIIMILVITEMSLLSLPTITGQLRPSVLWRSWNPRLLQSTNNILLVFKRMNKNKLWNHDYITFPNIICKSLLTILNK